MTDSKSTPSTGLTVAPADTTAAASADRLATRTPLLLSVDEAAQALGVGRTTMYALLGDGSVPSRYIRRRRLIAYADLERFAESLPRDPDGKAA